MKIFQLTALLIVLISCHTNELNQKKTKSAKNYFPEARAKVMVVGTFHFDYPGLDVQKTLKENEIDVLKEPKKSELTDLVEYIKKFRPNKIAIEAFPNWNATDKFKKYKTGEFRDKRDERYQLAMRIADDLRLDTLYSIDSWSMSEDLLKIDSTYMENLYEGFDFQSMDPYEKYAKNWLDEKDKLAVDMHLLDYFKLTNSRESHEYGYGLYLIGDFKLDNERGADILSSWWYNRNVRIFRKLQTITENENDRILMIFGNGHAAVLRQLIECSPEYEFIEFDSL